MEDPGRLILGGGQATSRCGSIPGQRGWCLRGATSVAVLGCACPHPSALPSWLLCPVPSKETLRTSRLPESKCLGEGAS